MKVSQLGKNAHPMGRSSVITPDHTESASPQARKERGAAEGGKARME